MSDTFLVTLYEGAADIFDITLVDGPTEEQFSVVLNEVTVIGPDLPKITIAVDAPENPEYHDLWFRLPSP